DTALESEFPRSDVVHIHGCIEDSESDSPALLYLPTETAFEPYLSAKMIETAWDGDGPPPPFQSNPEVQAHVQKRQEDLSNAHQKASKAIAGRQHLVLYGVSLAPVDVELTLLLWDVFRKKDGGSIYIVNPEWQSVADRLRVFCIDAEVALFYLDRLK